MALDRYVTDTGVFVRWFLNQEGWQEAQRYRDRFLRAEIGLETTEVARFELPHVLRRKGLLSGLLTLDEYRVAVRVIDDFEIPFAPLDVDRLEICATLAAERNLQFFDAVFVHCAIERDAPLLTTDARLTRAAERLDVDCVLLG